MKWKGIVTIEMGRAYAAECGCYVTTALDIKENNGNAICLVDGGIHQLNYDGQIKGMYRPQMAVIPPLHNERSALPEFPGDAGTRRPRGIL